MKTQTLWWYLDKSSNNALIQDQVIKAVMTQSLNPQIDSHCYADYSAGNRPLPLLAHLPIPLLPRAGILIPQLPGMCLPISPLPGVLSPTLSLQYLALQPENLLHHQKMLLHSLLHPKQQYTINCFWRMTRLGASQCTLPSTWDIVRVVPSIFVRFR